MFEFGNDLLAISGTSSRKKITLAVIFLLQTAPELFAYGFFPGATDRLVTNLAAGLPSERAPHKKGDGVPRHRHACVVFCKTLQ